MATQPLEPLAVVLPNDPRDPNPPDPLLPWTTIHQNVANEHYAELMTRIGRTIRDGGQAGDLALLCGAARDVAAIINGFHGR